jgi:hypothetical protein
VLERLGGRGHRPPLPYLSTLALLVPDLRSHLERVPQAHQPLLPLVPTQPTAPRKETLMPRRNNNRRRSIWTHRPSEPPDLSTDQLAMRLVLDRRADPVILGPLMRPFVYEEER